MIAFILYLILFLSLIYFTRFFNFFSDDKISKLQFTILFLGKAIAVPVFYLVYKKMYGGIEKFDAGKFYHDSQLITQFSKTNFLEYLKLLVGLQNENEGSYLYTNCLVNTDNWIDGRFRDFFYNDNRIVIRLHSLINFVSFESYFVNALFNCFFSFIGIVFIYKTFKNYFEGKEIFVLLILCFFPALWFYTGAVLKEGIALFIIGLTFFQLKKIIQSKFKLLNLFFLLFLIGVSFLLKPYLLLIIEFSVMLFFIIEKFEMIKYKSILFFIIFIGIFLILNNLSYYVKNKSLSSAAKQHLRAFEDASKGGIFLLDSLKFIRLEYDSTLITKSNINKNKYIIHKNVSFTYWEHSRQADTLYCVSNQDTLSEYDNIYNVPKSNSNFKITSTHLFSLISSCLFYSMCYPFFINVSNPLQILASFENLLILISLLFILFGCIKNIKSNFLPFVFVFFTFILCFIIGFTTPNSGAIFRYRSPAIVFILLAALYYFKNLKFFFYKK